MAENSAIQWTSDTWNPTTGCDKISDGCTNCYALTLAGRLKKMGQPKYQNDGDPRTSGPGFGVTVHPDALDVPLRWRKPRLVFVNSMSDLFHQRIPDVFVAKVFAVMAATPQHTYQILTKRHARMRSLASSEVFRQHVMGAARHWSPHPLRFPSYMDGGGLQQISWPLPNVWLGVSVEDQKCAGLRIPALLGTPAAVRFLSCEPLLGPVDVGCWLIGEGRPSTALHGAGGMTFTSGRKQIHWLIAGGESGADHRPVEATWIESLRDQCQIAEVAFFFKQWGGRTPKSGGRLLDGRTWDQMPAVAAP